MPDATRIALELRQYARLLNATADLLDPGGVTIVDLMLEAQEHEAPYGYKRDGTPRKRPAPNPENIVKARAARKTNP